jgi:acetyl esterase
MTLDPQAKAFLELAERSGRPLFETLDPPAARTLYDEAASISGGPTPDVFAVEDLAAEGPFGPIPLRAYTPRDSNGAALPVLIYFHGGGFVFGSRDSHDAPCRHLAREGDCIVVSVDYRMAPEYPFPQPVEDCQAACTWIIENIDRFSGDVARVAVGGDSAGANLATVMCLLANRDGEPQFVHQLLIYPATDLTRSFASHDALADGYRLTRPLIDWFMDHYFSGAEQDRRHDLGSPLFADDLAGLPPAFLVSAGYDPLKDECVAYYEKLRDQGVLARHRHYPGMIHGFISMGGFIDEGIACLTQCGAELKAAFAGQA